MTKAIQIRPVVSSDFPAWKLLWDGYNAFYGRHGETALPLEVTQMTWSRFFDVYEPMHALVAESAGELVGLAHVLFHVYWHTRETNTTAMQLYDKVGEKQGSVVYRKPL
jgi:hypothetical protein